MGLDVGRVAGFIRDQAGADQVSLAHRPLGGGAIQENHALDVRIEGGPLAGEHAWVLRSDAPSGVAASRSRAQEFALLGAAFAHGIRVPRPLWQCDDSAVNARPFYIMTRVTGRATPRDVVHIERTAAARRRLVEALARELARIHAIDPGSAGLDFLARPSQPAATQRIGEYRAYLDTLTDPQPVLEWALRRLELSAPQGTDTVLCHGDFRTGNIMLDGDTVTGILDWEFAGLGSPVEDLGWYCARCWRFGVDRFAAGGIGTRNDFLTAYEQASGRHVPAREITWWQLMAEVRWAVIALQQTGRHLCGQESSLELALTGYLVPEMEMNLLRGLAPR